jgi:rhomboid protease GluP
VSKLRVTYNAPVVLTFALLAVVVQLLPTQIHDDWFVDKPQFVLSLQGVVRLFTHVLGHASWQHLLGNFMLILLIGPILEERHGSLPLLGMIAMTALATGVAYMLFSGGALLGASGVAFMMILLGSMVNIKSGEIPLTFIAVAFLYLGAEITQAFNNDGIAHTAHLLGGVVGAAFGFLSAGAKKPAQPASLLAGTAKPAAQMK